MDDSTAIWTTQTVGRELRVVSYYENSGEGLAHYANYLKEWAQARDVRFSRHVMPHDVEVREMGTGKSRKQVAMGMGITPIYTAPMLSVEDGIEAVRRIIPRCYFDERACERGISALTEYGKDWDEKSKTFRNKPRHDWSSHASDAFRYLAVTMRDRAFGTPPPAMPKAPVWRVFG
jgi:hypothetical protein